MVIALKFFGADKPGRQTKNRSGDTIRYICNECFSFDVTKTNDGYVCNNCIQNKESGIVIESSG